VHPNLTHASVGPREYIPVCPTHRSWKCLHDAAPRYLADLCVPAASTDGRRQSRSVVSGALLVQPWTRTSTGHRRFAVYGPRTWNRLPTALRSPELSLSILAPAQDPLVCSSTRQCWLQLWVSCTVVRRCCDCTTSSAPTTNVPTRPPREDICRR